MMMCKGNDVECGGLTPLFFDTHLTHRVAARQAGLHENAVKPAYSKTASRQEQFGKLARSGNAPNKG